MDITQTKIGIIGSGQLGKMLLYETSKLGIVAGILSNEADAPAKDLCNEFIVGSYTDFDVVYNFGIDKNVVTIELENVNTDALEKLASEGVYVYPQPSVLKTIKDKGLQKQFYAHHEIPTAPFRLLNSADDILKSVQLGEIKFPFVQKARVGGYDGRGVEVINSQADMINLLEASSVIEEKIDIACELAVIVARNKKGEINVFPGVEMAFNPKANLIDMLFFPARVSEKIMNQASAIARQLAEKFNIIGLLAVEMFVDKSGNIFVNEVAPRPHNSGHQTIEGCFTSQFQQHMRAILNLPLGSTAVKIPSIMVNILGEPGYSGEVVYDGLKECMALEGVYVHLYGKKVTKPYRKLGHVTICNKDINEAEKIAAFVKQTLKAKSANKIASY